AEQLRGIDVQEMGNRLLKDLLGAARASMRQAKLEPAEIKQRRRQLEALLAGVNLTDVALKQLDANIFSRAIDAIEQKFDKEPLVQAQLYQTLADTLRDLGLLDRAALPQEQALTIRRRVLGDANIETLDSM